VRLCSADSTSTVAIERADLGYSTYVDYAAAASAMRARAEAFADLASDDDLDVRHAALPGVALFVDDPLDNDVDSSPIAITCGPTRSRHCGRSATSTRRWCSRCTVSSTKAPRSR
jgi:hypothetical protein